MKVSLPFSYRCNGTMECSCSTHWADCNGTRLQGRIVPCTGP